MKEKIIQKQMDRKSFHHYAGKTNSSFLKVLLKRYLVFLILSCSFSDISAGSNENAITIFVPKTLSSIPAMELHNVIINNKKIIIEAYDDHILTMAEFINGEIKILMTGFTQGLSYYRTAKDIVMISTPVWGVSSLITNDPRFVKLSDFKDKTILVPFAKSPLDLQFTSILKKEGLYNKVKIDYAPVQQQIPLLLAGKVSGICIPEPLTSKLIIEKKGYIVFKFSEKWKELNNGEWRSPQVSIFAKKDFSRKNNELLVKIIILLKDNIIKISADPNFFSTKYTDFFHLDPEIIKRGLKSVIFEVPNYAASVKICRDYEKAIDDNEEIEDGFFFKY